MHAPFCFVHQDYQTPWRWTVWYSKQGSVGESLWKHRSRREDATTTGFKRREGQVPPGGGHHGSVLAP